MKELKDTIDLMTSSDYRERFLAEYEQTKIRYEKLNAMIVKYEAGTLAFSPKCPIDLLKDQKECMGDYLYYLALRAEIEKINLDNEGE